MAINNTLKSSSVLGLQQVSPAWKAWGSTMTIGSDGLLKPKKTTPAPSSTQSTSSSYSAPSTSSYSAPATSTPNVNMSPQLSSLYSQLSAAQKRLTELQSQKGSNAAQTQQTSSTGSTRGLFPDVISSLAKYGNEMSDEVRQAQEDYQKSVENLRKFRESIADKKAGIYSDPVSARVMQGRDAALQQANAEKLAAYQGAVQESQQGVGYAQTQQQLQQQALQQAAQLAQPQQVAPGSSLYSPFGGEAIAGGLGGYVPYQTAEQVMSLIQQYPDAGYQYNSSLSPQQNLQAAQAAIQRSPTYQRSTYGVPGAQTVVGATQTQAAQQGYSESVQTYNTLYSQFQNAEQLGDNVLNIMRSEGINPTDARYANQSIQQIRRQLSSAQQQRFDTALQEARNAFGNLVATGGGVTPTGAESAYETLLSPNASLGAITAAIEQLKNAGNIRLNAEYQRVQNYYNQLNSGGSGGGYSGGGGGLYDF